MHETEFRRCLVEIDVEGMRRLWAHVSPHLPQPYCDAEALETIHRARVDMATLAPDARRYSMDWLRERETSRVVSAVGIAVKAINESRKTQAAEMQHAMSQAVADAVRDGVSLDTEADEIRARIAAARKRMAWR